MKTSKSVESGFEIGFCDKILLFINVAVGCSKCPKSKSMKNFRNLYDKTNDKLEQNLDIVQFIKKETITLDPEISEAA